MNEETTVRPPSYIAMHRYTTTRKKSNAYVIVYVEEEEDRCRERGVGGGGIEQANEIEK